MMGKNFLGKIKKMIGGVGLMVGGIVGRRGMFLGGVG
jgi:hypothetical protein